MSEKSNHKKPFYKRWKFWAIALGVLFIIGLFAPDEADIISPNAEEVKSEEEVAEEKAKEKELRKRTEEMRKKQKATEEAEAAKKAEEEKAEKEEEQAVRDIENREAFQNIIDLSEDIIVSIEPNPGTNDWQTIIVTVSDEWYISPDHTKERFVETVGSSIKEIAVSDVTHVHFDDTYGKRVAAEKLFGGYDIKR